VGDLLDPHDELEMRVGRDLESAEDVGDEAVLRHGALVPAAVRLDLLAEREHLGGQLADVVAAVEQGEALELGDEVPHVDVDDGLDHVEHEAQQDDAAVDLALGQLAGVAELDLVHEEGLVGLGGHVVLHRRMDEVQDGSDVDAVARDQPGVAGSVGVDGAHDEGRPGGGRDESGGVVPVGPVGPRCDMLLGHVLVVLDEVLEAGEVEVGDFLAGEGVRGRSYGSGPLGGHIGGYLEAEVDSLAGHEVEPLLVVVDVDRDDLVPGSASAGLQEGEAPFVGAQVEHGERHGESGHAGSSYSGGRGSGWIRGSPPTSIRGSLSATIRGSGIVVPTTAVGRGRLVFGGPVSAIVSLLGGILVSPAGSGGVVVVLVIFGRHDG